MCDQIENWDDLAQEEQEKLRAGHDEDEIEAIAEAV